MPEAQETQMDFIAKVNDEMGIKRSLGVLPILQDLYGTGLPAVIGEARKNNMSAGQFVQKLSSDFGLEPGDEMRIKYMAALVNYAREEMSDDIHASCVVRNGSVYSDLEEGGVMRLSVGSPGMDGKIQFDVSVAKDVSIQDGSVPDDAEFSFVTSASDIEDALVAFNNEYNPDPGVRLV